MKNEKKITETEIETKISELLRDFQTILLGKQNNEILETGLLTF